MQCPAARSPSRAESVQWVNGRPQTVGRGGNSDDLAALGDGHPRGLRPARRPGRSRRLALKPAAVKDGVTSILVTPGKIRRRSAPPGTGGRRAGAAAANGEIRRLGHGQFATHSGHREGLVCGVWPFHRSVGTSSLSTKNAPSFEHLNHTFSMLYEPSVRLLNGCPAMLPRQ